MFTVSTIAADVVEGHDEADDDADGTEDEEGDGESDLLDGRPVIHRIRGLHHYVVVSYRERVVHVRHFLPFLPRAHSFSISLSCLCNLFDIFSFERETI